MWRKKRKEQKVPEGTGVQIPGTKKPGSHLLSRPEGSIIGAGGLDFRVRDGNGYCTSAMAKPNQIRRNIRIDEKQLRQSFLEVRSNGNELTANSSQGVRSNGNI